MSKNQFLKNLYSGAQCGGFQLMLILDLWGISFHTVVVFGLGKNLLFKSVLGHCGLLKQGPALPAHMVAVPYVF